jgi:iron complex outermembrane recepter protein
MNKIVLLSLPFLAATLPTLADSEANPSDKPKVDKSRLEHVLVTMPVHKTEARTALPVTVLDQETLHRKAAATIGETLNHSPGLASASFGPAVGQPIIRGQQGPRVAVLQNSLPALDVSTNSADHAVSVEPVLADSIEVLRGPSTLLYGGGAIGGVVNVIDRGIPNRAVEGFEGAVEARHNSVNDGRTGIARLDMGNGNWSWHLDGLYRDWNEPDIPGLAVNRNTADEEALEESSDGYIANASGRTRRFTLGTAYQFDNGYAGISYSELSNFYGIPAGVHHHHEEEGADHEEEGHEEEEGGISLDVSQRRWEAAGDLHGDGFWEVFRWRAAYSDYEHREIEADGATGTLFTKDAWALRGELGHRELGPVHGVLGVQYQESDFAAIGEEAFVPATTNRALGLFWLEDYHSERWQLEGGLRVDLDQLDSDEPELDDNDLTLINGSLAALYDLNDNWTVSAAFSEARRAPGAEERFSNVLNNASSYVVHGASGAIEVGDAGLRREKSDNVEMSLKADYERVTGSVTAFDNQFSDFIFLRNTGTVIEDTPVLAYSQEDARFRGVEYELGFSLLPYSSDAELQLRLFGDRVRAKLDNGDHVPRLPPRRDGVGLSWQSGDWYADLNWVLAGKQDKPGSNETETDSYQRVDANLTWSIEGNDGNRYTALLKLGNLGDEEIRNSTSFIRDSAPEAGRSIELGLRVEFGVL